MNNYKSYTITIYNIPTYINMIIKYVQSRLYFNLPELKQRARKITMEEVTFFMFTTYLYYFMYILIIFSKYLIDPKIARLVGRVAKRKIFKVYFDQCVHSWLLGDHAHQLFFFVFAI